VSDLAPRVRCPTLVTHAREDGRIPFEEGRRIASQIPGARFVPLETANHIPLEGEPALAQFLREIEALLAVPDDRAVPPLAGLSELTVRERQVLEQVAEGLANDEIAHALSLSPKTVRNHVSRIFDKLQVTTRAQAIVRARDSGLGRDRRGYDPAP
jgi:DNA-binding NarL/FixJ family response regulator